MYAEPLLERAERLLACAMWALARLLLERAVLLGNGRSAHLLAQTYDPRKLRAWGIVGIKGDLLKAKEFYDWAQTGAHSATHTR